MIELKFAPEIASAAPGLKVIAIEANVVNGPTNEALWAEIERAGERLRQEYELSQVNSRPAIAATRQAYKALGKDPNRYRPSADALCRRLVKGMELYRTRSVVDAINLISINTGHSIGGFDADKIEGDVLTLGRGRDGEPFEAIGRGMLNIEGLPVYRDSVGGVGTPTSDNERTKLTDGTTRLLMIINCYGESECDPAAVEAMALRTLRDYCGTTATEVAHYTVQ